MAKRVVKTTKNKTVVRDNTKMTGRQKLKKAKLDASTKRTADMEKTSRTKARSAALASATASMTAERERTNRARIKQTAEELAIQQKMNILNGNINGESATGENPSSPDDSSFSSIEVN